MFRWKDFTIKRFYGLDNQTNIVDVLDGKALDCDNVFLDSDGVISKRPGEEIMFARDEAGAIAIDELGTCKLNGTRYWFKFSNGDFSHSTSRNGALTVLSPNPEISTTNQIWWAVLDDKLFFVDGTNVPRYFDGTDIKTSSIYARPTVDLTGGSGSGFDYTYTVDNGLGESPARAISINYGSGSSVTVPGNTGPQTLIAGDKIRIYSKVQTVAAGSKNVTKTSGTFVDTFSNVCGNYGSDESGGVAQITVPAFIGFVIETVAISDAQPQLYTELGLAINKSAPTGLTGITKHYNRLIGWKDSDVYCSKVTNPHSWPDATAQKEAFVYSVLDGDGDTIQRCITFRESLFVLKPSEVFIFGGIGPDDTGNNAFTFRRLESNGHGCIAPKSAAVVGEHGSLALIYLSRNGFMATNGDSPLLIGDEINNQIRTIGETTLATSYAVHDRKYGIYLCAVGAASLRTVWVLDVRTHQVGDKEILFGWFKWSLNQVKTMFFDSDRVLFGRYDGICTSQRVSGTPSDFRDVLQDFIPAIEFFHTIDTILVNVKFQTGDPVVIRTSGVMPTGLTANTTYYVIANGLSIKLATTLENALAGTAINFTTSGSGTHSIVGAQAISAHYTTNWLNFKSPMVVKKLSKPGIVFNAIAPQVSMDIQTAYDWIPTFTDPDSIQGGGDHPWGNDNWGNGFVWGGGVVASPLNYALPRRKVRSIQFKFSNAEIDQDFNLQSLNLPFDYIRNRGAY